MKWVNPLHYPLAVLAGGILLVVGVRLVRVPSWVMVPVAAGVTIGMARVRQSQEPVLINLGNAELERQVRAVQQQARQLADKTQTFRTEATRLLTKADQMELLVAVQYACDRAMELPGKIDQLVTHLQGHEALLSRQELQQQLADVETRLRSSSGVARDQLQTLAARLQENLELVRQGQDVRQAQVANLAMLVTETAGALQALQNRLRTANLADATQTSEVRSLSEELNQMQETVNLLVSR